MSRQTLFSASEYERLVRLMGELGELAAASPDAAIDHLLKFVNRKLDATASVVQLGYPEGFSNGKGRRPWKVVHQFVYGLEASQERLWRDWFFERGGQFEHPLFLASIRRAGQRRAHTRRQLVADDVWYGNAFVNECLHQVGFDHSIASIVPVGGHAEFALAAARRLGERPNTTAELGWLEMLNGHLSWLYRLHSQQQPANPQANGTTAPRLTPRLQETVKLLREGRSEKQIAKAMNLTQRSAHKYVERVYRAYGVHSRAELMALWTH